MIKLLFLRAFPLLLRPLVVLLEGMFLSADSIIVLVLPLAMTALIISSIPVHLDYFKASPTDPKYGALGETYIAALSWLSLFSIIAMVPLLFILPLSLSGMMVAATCLLFLTEKLADETSRALEFRKAFVHWFFVQIFRSGWMLVALGLAILGLPYPMVFLTMSVLACAVIFIIFRHVVGLKPSFSLRGIKPIHQNLVFLAGSFLPASYQQFPRIVVAKLFPEQAHIFLAVSQLTQGIGLLFAVRYQIPYRRIIARKPITFQRRLQSRMFAMLAISTLIAFLYYIGSFFINTNDLSPFYLTALLVPITTINALVFSILVAYLGYIQWFASKIKIAYLYLICISIYALFYLLVYFKLITDISIIAIPVLAMAFGLIWLTIIIFWFFPKKARDI